MKFYIAEKTSFIQRQTLSSFEQKGLKDDSSLSEHDEYMDWYFWQKVYDESRKLIKRYRIFLEDEMRFLT